jgi:glycosyltransferase involved in cell wall biosynthesis
MNAYHVGFVMEQALGHLTHHRNLARAITRHPGLRPVWLPIHYEADDRWSRCPIVRNNCSLRLSLRARDHVCQCLQTQWLDGLFVHTQVLGLASLGIMQYVPTIVSLDATPKNMDSVGAGYGHQPARGPIERLKDLWNQTLFRRATALVAFSYWVKESLERDYGIDGHKIHVVHPGVHLSDWEPAEAEQDTKRPLRLLFVGSHFQRKGGQVLLEAMRVRLAERCTLDIITQDESLRSSGSVRVHRWAVGNDFALQQLYRHADLFVLPTLGDCLPWTILEAMASGLPVVASDVGAIREAVADGVTGILIPPGDISALILAVDALAGDSVRRRAFARAARARAERLFGAARNYRLLAEVIVRSIGRSRHRRPRTSAVTFGNTLRERLWAMRACLAGLAC